MMTGIVTSLREAVLRLRLYDGRGQEQEYASVVHTGYNGTLTLAPDAIERLGLSWHRFGHGLLADGTDSTFNVYKGDILWDGERVTITIDEMDADSLTGMSLMYGYELVLPILDGATFTLRRLGE
jgi:predicted aspartyl protease